VRGDRDKLLRFHVEEKPLALQLGGSDPGPLALAARMGEQAGYDEINLNCGCPSDKVQRGEFGACLMREPVRVAECVAAMRSAVRIPVTVKMRIGTVLGSDPERNAHMRRFSDTDYAALSDFVRETSAAGCTRYIVHARKAVLGGFSPRDNREVPPLHYAVVPRLKCDFPALAFEVNGGLRTVAAVLEALATADGVMLGREAYHRPTLLAELALALHDRPLPDSQTLLARMAEYAHAECARGERLSAITRHMLGWFSQAPGAREFRRVLSEGSRASGASPDLIWQAAAQVLPSLPAKPQLQTPPSIV
jgi:tRNA-dihydrouridine synthase A